MSVCLNHTDRPANTRCSACHKPICNSCVVEISGAIYCSKACAENAARFNANYRPDRGPGFFGQIKNLIVSIVGLAVVATVAVFIFAKVLKIDFFITLLKKFGL